MSLPVSQYEALLAEVRDLRRKAQRVQQLARPLLQSDSSTPPPPLEAFSRIPRLQSPPEISYLRTNFHQNDGICEPLDYTMESLLLGRQHSTPSGSTNYEPGVASSVEGDACSEDEYGGARSTTKMSVSSEPVSQRTRGMGSLYHGTWPVERTMWNSEPASLGAGAKKPAQGGMSNQMEVTSVMSFASSSGGVPLDRVLGSSPERPGKWSSQQLEAKMDVVHSLLAMLGGQEHVDMGETLLALSTCPESCLAMRQSGCIPLLVQLVQSDRDGDTRQKASQALHNLVNSQPDEKLRKRESRILKLLDQCRSYTEAVRNNTEYEQPESSSMSEVDGDKHPVQTVAHLMKLSFDEGHRQAICHLGGIHTIASLVEVEHTMHGSTTNENHCILLRRYACMALTNLTFGDSGNKALLCSFREFMRALVIQLQSPSDELRQVTASVLRNLSWRADSTSKEILREVGSVTGLMKAAMLDNKENTLKSILSALWNLSAHCTENKSEICSVEGALGFLVDMLTYKTPSKSMAIIENSGGILRNISSQIAVREDYREVLRSHDCLQILLDQLKSPSLTIVSNACGTLWNLSAKCSADQEALWQMGAPAMLRSLNHSKHKMIAMGSSAALKNLLSARPQQSFFPPMDSTALSLDLPALPTLGVRKQKALLQDLDQNLSETYENIEKDSPGKRGEKEGVVTDFMQDSCHKTKANPDYMKHPSRSKSNVDEGYLNATFASLNLNEPSTSYASDFRTKSRIPQSYGSSSLPYMAPPMKRTSPCTYIPVRNKFSDCAYEDEIDVSDQPIDYSQKYSETKLPNNDANNLSSSKDRDGFPYSKPKAKEESLGIYAETDLDQPTDYSLRYAEDDSDSDICDKISKDEPQEYVQDTIKTYCTEDTPYETPFNFSTATSMSDLRMDEKPVIDNDKLKESTPKPNKEVNKSVDEKDHCSTEDISEIDNRPKLEDKIPKSELSSGLMSPEKPVNYCDEGTPGYFSRVSSFGSLNSIPPNEKLKSEPKENAGLEQENEQQEKQVEKTPPKTPSEVKAVKFERVVNYAEETPLMFSRSSSLASLDSIEQHSIHDDRSSVVSDFSRLTSGIVSPSELPDSPTQTVPPSPKPRKTPLEFPSTSKPRLSVDIRPQPAPRAVAKPSVFEDNVTKFKEESTPIQFSSATSLSSLTIDDHEEANDTNEEKRTKVKQSDQSGEDNPEGKDDDAEVEKKDVEKETNVSDDTDEFNPGSEDEGDEDLLAACINMGKQKTQQSSPPPSSKLPLSNKYAQTSQSSSGLPVSRRSPCSFVPPTNIVEPPSRLSGDTSQSYSNDDLPKGSKLDRLLDNGEDSTKKDYLSDDGSLLSEEERLLAECIRAGKPQPKNEPSTHNLNPASYFSRSASMDGSLSTVGMRSEHSLPMYLPSRDEVANYAVEDSSPYECSLSSSLSGLTVEGSIAGLKKQNPPNTQVSPLIIKALPSDNKYTYARQPSSSTHQSQADNNSPKAAKSSTSENTQVTSKSNFYSNNDQIDLNNDELSDDGSLLSDEERLLAECIRAGKPQPKQEQPRFDTKPTAYVPNRKPGESVKTPRARADIRRENSLPPYLPSRDQIQSNSGVEHNISCSYSLSSSLNGLAYEGRLRSRQNVPRAESIATTSKLPSTSKYSHTSQSSSGIPLSRGSPSSLPQPFHPTPTSKVYSTETASSDPYRNSKISPKKDDWSDDGSLLSEEERLLAECIRAGKPQARQEQSNYNVKNVPYQPKRQIETSIPYIYNPSGNTRRGSGEASKVSRSDINRRENSLPPYLQSREEADNYMVENNGSCSVRPSPCGLAAEGGGTRIKRSFQSSHQGATGCGLSIKSSTQQQSNSLTCTDQNRCPREPSARDLLTDAEKALLEQCIESGKPKSRSLLPQKPINVPLARHVERRSMGKSLSRDRQLAEQDEQKPKNVSAASVAGSTTIQASETCPEMPPAAAGVGENPEPEIGTERRTGSPEPSRGEAGMSEIRTDISRDKCSPSEGTSSTDLMKSGFSKSVTKGLETHDFNNHTTSFAFSASDNIVIGECLARSCEESKIVDNRMLDPDAMIESLDRFTAELVSQASHLNKDEDKYKVSTGDNTWNDDTSPNEVTFPSISCSAPNVITFSNEDDSNKIEADLVDGINDRKEEVPSNDFSSINTSTMTESTLIAIEASKMVSVFKNEAEMSLSVNSIASLELDHVQPPSHLNSLSNSAVGLDKGVPKSPKLIARKKSLPAGLMVRRALSNSLNHGSSLESLENHSLSNLDHVNPPSDLRDVFDMEGSMTSVASLPSENEVRTDFVLSSVVSKEMQDRHQHPIFNIKQPFSGTNYSCELENINPPSLFNEITDFCNSLADVPTEAICSETADIFEDCYTHIADNTVLQEENVTLADDVTEFSDAHSVTPILSDLSSAESTPKKTKNLSKSMTTKQRRNLARDRYKTYTVAAEMVMWEEGKKLKENSESTEDFVTAQEPLSKSVNDTTYVSPTYSVDTPKLTPREKRRMNRSRFETQVLDESITNTLHQPVIETPPPSDSQNQSCDSNSCESSPAQSPARTKLSIRRNFMQKRLENKDRFRTQTLSESSFSPDVSSASPPLINGEAELHLHLQKGADLVLRTLRDTKTSQDELLDCETLSLVSNDDDSEHNSGSSVNYRTYHKSWGFRKNNIPIINSSNSNQDGQANCRSNFANDPKGLSDELTAANLHSNYLNSEGEEEENEQRPPGKPKIVKPLEKPQEQVEEVVNEEQGKGIRGRRKPLYSKANLNNKVAPKNIKPIKTMTSNLVKNVTSTLKSSTALKSVVNKQNKTTVVKSPAVQSKTSSGYGSKAVSKTNSPKTSPARIPLIKGSPKHVLVAPKQQIVTPKGTPPMERQGTFTKDDPSPSNIPKPSSKIPTPSSASKIPAFTSKIARSVAPTTSKIPNNSAKPPTIARNGFVKSSSSDRANKNTRVYNRSTSADSREPVRKMQVSPSSYSLKSETRVQNGAVKKSGIPSPAQRSNSNSSINSNGSTSAKKQVTSKIASLWKKIEDSKKQPPKKDSRVWIQPESEPDPPRLIRSNTFDNKDEAAILRNKVTEDGDPTKRISRLGSFIIMDESEDAIRLQQAIGAAAVPAANVV